MLGDASGRRAEEWRCLEASGISPAKCWAEGETVRIRALVVPRLLSVAALAATVAACGGGSSPQPVRGTVFGGTQAAATVFSATGGGTGVCGGAIAGTQVIVKGPSGALLATTRLRKDASASSALKLPAALTGGDGQLGVYEFSTSIPAGKGPYTIDLVDVSNLVVSAKQLDHLELTCG